VYDIENRSSIQRRAAVGTIEKDTIALNHFRHIGTTREGTEIVQEQIWYVDDIRQTCLQRSAPVSGGSGDATCMD